MPGMPPSLPGPVAPEAVLEHIPTGADVIVPMANGEPVSALDALEANADRLTGVRVHQMHALHERAYHHGQYPGLRHVSYFLSPATRPSYWAGSLDLVPANFSEMPQTLRRNTKCSLVIAAASPADQHGNFSLGTNAEYVSTIIGHAPFFLEVNPRMPRTFGLNSIHSSQIVGYCEAERDLVEVHSMVGGEADRAIAATVAERIPDRATLQVGIGGIPNALLANLRGHRDLGVHTELLSDGIMELVEAGVVTGVHKKLRRSKVVTTFALGTQRLYDFMHHNASLEMLPVDWVNDPRVIAREDNFVSINATTEVDLYGQCASETIQGRYWSSSGGQADFARGAMYSPGGQAFIVLRSSATNGRSRIRARLTEGSIVTTLKNTVDNVVTEHGIAELRGRSIADRARALIEVAHPDHRETLEREGREAGIIPAPADRAPQPPERRRAHAEAPRG
jgi:acyl-CoA hydrolase